MKKKNRKSEPFEAIPLVLDKEVERVTQLPINNPERCRVLKIIMDEEEKKRAA